MDTLQRLTPKQGVDPVHHKYKAHFYNCSITNRPVISVLQYNAAFFTLEERRNGWVVVHFFISLYCFAALAVLCDQYFCASLEKLCKSLRIPTDVAGATFMAAGSSMPTLFIAIASVFMDEGDIGLGTIIGSTMFNILFITSICGLFSGMVITLRTWPLIRDSVVYVVHLTGLLVVIHDNVVHFYEALLFPLMYSFYILIMIFNRRLEEVMEDFFKKCCCFYKDGDMIEMDDPRELKQESSKDEKSIKTSQDHHDLQNTRPKLDNSQQMICSDAENLKELVPDSSTKDQGPSQPHGFEPSSPFSFPETFPKMGVWFLLIPLHVLFYVTMPDCRKKDWESWYPLTFFVSILWMAAISYVLVWAVSIIGQTLHIPECIMGLTLLAAGSSVPDVISSLVVAQHGMGDMALANCVGSNIFDILCLGLPWFLATTLVHPHSVVLIQSGHIVYTAMCLFGTVFVTLLVIHLNKWKLDKRMGCVLLIVYFVFITVAVLLEALPVGPGGHGGEAKLIPHHPGHVPRKGLGHRKHHYTHTGRHGKHTV